jgi:hypothetical protein
MMSHGLPLILSIWGAKIRAAVAVMGAVNVFFFFLIRSEVLSTLSLRILTPPHNPKRSVGLYHSCQSMMSHGLPLILSIWGAKIRAAVAVMGAVNVSGI